MTDPSTDPAGHRSPPRDRGDGSGAEAGSGPRRSRGQSILNTVIGFAIIVELIWLVGHAIFATGPKFAATPRPLLYRAPLPPSGRGVLLALASAAAVQPALARSGRTPYAYVKTAWWRLNPRVLEGSGPSRARPSVTESWLERNGAGRTLTMKSGSKSDDTAVAAGEPLPALSPNGAALARQLTSGYPTGDGPGGEFTALTDLSKRQPIPPGVEAGALRVLAGVPGVTNSGTVIDRAGRPGVAVTVDIDAGELTSYTLIFDPSTGRLLEQEQTLLGNPDKLDVRVGSVLAYTTFLASGYVANTATRP